jgi:hypothetical protein
MNGVFVIFKKKKYRKMGVKDEKNNNDIAVECV